MNGPGSDEAARRFLVDAATEGARLDQFVGRSLGVSASAARRLIEEGAVRVGRQPGRKGSRLCSGDVVEIVASALGDDAVLADPHLQVKVVHLDHDLVAIDKPGGVPSHPLQRGEVGTAANAIVARFPECAGASLDPREGGLGHRLDTATSGVLIAARSREAWLGLRQALAAQDCQKSYLCEVWGAPPPVGRVDADIGRTGRRGGAVRVGGAGRQPRAAETSWTVRASGSRTALLEARLHAGRAHQVRAHLASAGFPIVGDDRYGGLSEPGRATGEPPGDGDGPGQEGQGGAVAPSSLHLHAASVQLRHPITGAPVVITAPPPPWARRLLDAVTPVD